MNKQIAKKAMVSVVYIILLILVSALAILYASGYRVSKNRVYKVSVVHFVSDPAAQVIINGVDENIQSPQAIYLEPGNYQVELASPGYQSQFYTIGLGSGEFFERKDITLFKTGIKPKVEDLLQVDPNSLVDESLVNDSDLFIASEHEIWIANRLITRFSDRLISLSYYTNRNYIFYQTDKAVGIISKDGMNNFSIFDYQTTNSLKFTFKNRGQVLQAHDGDKLVTAKIR